MNNFSRLEDRIQYKFTDITILEKSLTHKSYSNEFGGENYERLEFLGDAIIEFVVSDSLINYKELDAGELSKLRAKLVSTNYLYDIAISLGLNQYVQKSKSLPSLSKKNTADLFESLIGAIYLDGGLDNAKRVIQQYILINDKNISNVIKNVKDYKTLLQEKLQKEGTPFNYELVSSKGRDHEKVFYVKLVVENLSIEGEGRSIQLAEEDCAKKYLERGE